MIKSILSGLPALQKGAQEQVVLNKYLFEAFYTYVDFLYLFSTPGRSNTSQCTDLCLRDSDSIIHMAKIISLLKLTFITYFYLYNESNFVFLSKTLNNVQCIMFCFVSGEFFLQLLQDARLRYFHRRKAAPPSHRYVKLYELMRNQF